MTNENKVANSSYKKSVNIMTSLAQIMPLYINNIYRTWSTVEINWLYDITNTIVHFGAD